MPLNRDDVKGGLNRTKKRPAPRLSREDAKAAVHAYRATGTLPSSTFADPIATLPVKHPAPLEQAAGRRPGLYKIGPDGRLAPFVPDPPMGLDKAVGMVFGVRPSTLAKVVEHPLRFAEHNRKKFEQSGYRSADLTPANLIAAAGLFGSPVSSSVAKRGAAKGLETRFAGGGQDDLERRITRLEFVAAQTPIDAAHAYEIRRAKGDLEVLKALRGKDFSAARAERPAKSQFDGLKPGDRFTAKGPNGEFDAFVDNEGVPRRMSDNEPLYGIGNPYPVAGLKSEIQAKLAGGQYEYVGPLDKKSLADLYPGDVAPSGSSLPAGAKEVVDRLGGAAKLRVQQDKLYSQERAKRIGEAERLMNEIGGIEGHKAALKALSGELPKLEFNGFKDFDQSTVTDLFSHINSHPELRPYEKVRTRDAILHLFEGKVPQKSEIRLLETAFGRETTGSLEASVSFWKQAKDAGLSLINVPRALKSSFDVSAPFRQGLVLGARHPRMFASEFKPMLKAFKSEGAYQEVMDDIASRPTFQTMRDAKLALTDLENVSTREEQFMSNLAEKIPVAGRGVRASGRAYVVFLNKFRADAFDNYLKTAEADGRTFTDKELHDIASWVNHATGRGSIKGLEGAMVPLNALLFSPRLIASRLQLLNPGYYASLSPFARKQALIGMGNLVGSVSLTLYMAHLAGAQVGLDPRSANFGKIRVGNTRVDVMGGFQQYIVAATRLYKKEMVSSTSGELVSLQGGFAKPSRADIAMNFAEGKLAPVPRFLDQWAHNENNNLQPFNPLKEAPWLFAPLGPQNAAQTHRQEGPAAAAVGLGLGSIGFGVQTYGPQADKDFKNQMKVIDKAVKAGQLSPERAAEAKRDLERVHKVQTHDTKENRREFLIDTMRDQGYQDAEINDALHQLGYEPVG